MRVIPYLGLMASLLLAACLEKAGDGPEADQLPSSSTEVEVVYTGHGFPVLPRDPLWGDRPEDQPVIAELLRALQSAAVVDGPLDPVPHGRTEFLVIRHSDGGLTQVREAVRCTSTNGGEHCKTVRNRWVLEGTGVALASDAMRRWWDKMPDYMPYAERLIVPDRVYQGQSLVLRGQGWHESDHVELRIFPQFRRSEGTLLLDRVPLDHGAFLWKGILPRALDSGWYTIIAEAGARTESGDIELSSADQAEPPRPMLPEPAARAAIQRLTTPGGIAEVVSGFGGYFLDPQDNSVVYVWAYFNGRWWEATPLLHDGSGNPPRGWGNPYDMVTMEMVSEGLARFTSRAGQTAEFKPPPVEVAGVPGDSV